MDEQPDPPEEPDRGDEPSESGESPPPDPESEGAGDEAGSGTDAGEAPDRDEPPEEAESGSEGDRSGREEGEADEAGGEPVTENQEESSPDVAFDEDPGYEDPLDDPVYRESAADSPGEHSGGEPSDASEAPDSASTDGEVANGGTPDLPEEARNMEAPDPGAGRQQPYDPNKPMGGYFEDSGGPEADSEMPLTAHIEEMLKRLMVVVAIAGVVSVAAYPFTEQVINFLWNSIVGQSTRPHLYGVLELLFTKLKVASLAGLIVALPVVVYETYQFMRPGLYPHERRYYLAAVPTSLVLALLGVSFAYFVVLPALFQYFLSYTKPVVSGAGAAVAGTAGIGLALGRTFDLILVLMGYLAIVFQIPLLIMLAMMMNVVTRQWLADRRLLFWGGFLGLSFLLFGPTDPTGASPFLVSITMILLFEGTLFLVKWTRRARGE